MLYDKKSEYEEMFEHTAVINGSAVSLTFVYLC